MHLKLNSAKSHIFGNDIGNLFFVVCCVANNLLKKSSWMHHIRGMILLLSKTICYAAENSFLWHNNSYQGWPSVKILTKILNIWANRTICLEILFWIRDESSFFLITTNSWINIVHEQRFIIGIVPDYYKMQMEKREKTLQF